MMSEDVTVAYGRRVSTMRNRVATRQGSEDGSVTLGGRRVPIVRPRMRATDGSGELPIPSYEVFRTEVLGRLAMAFSAADSRSALLGAAPPP
jgi:putative transposase